MAIQQTKRQSDLEKRLQLLRRQVYGRNSYQLSDKMQNKSDDSGPQKGKITESYSVSDITYLQQDLLKILIFSSVAIGIQIILFFLLKNHILNLVF